VRALLHGQRGLDDDDDNENNNNYNTKFIIKRHSAVRRLQRRWRNR